MGLGMCNWIQPSRCCSPRCARDQAADRLLVAFVLPLVGVGILVCGDVVDVDVVRRIERAPVFVGVVEARDRALLDRAARLVAFLLRLALVLGRRVGTEVLHARGRCAVGWAAGPRTAEPAAGRTRRVAGRTAGRTREPAARTPGTRTAEPAGPRTAGTALFTWTRFADRESAPLEQRLVELANGFFGNRTIRVVDERETARTARLAIDGQDDRCGFADAREVLPQLCLGRRVGQVADEQTDRHIGPRQNNTV